MNENMELNPNKDEELNLEQLQQKISQLEASLIASENKSAEHWNLLLRTKADEENTRRRARIDVENAHKYGIEKFARVMLDVVDSLELGIGSTVIQDHQKNNEATIQSLKDGMELTLKLMLNSLEQFGIKMLNPLGETFNPTQHEALSMQEQPGATPNSILMVVRKGFVMHDRVLRPARVIVAKEA